MKLYRYMSWGEFYDLWNGLPLVSDNRTCKKSKTTSEGFCFLAESTIVESEAGIYEFDPVRCYDFLSGIVSDEVLVECEVFEPEHFTKGFGVYADPMTGGWYDTIQIVEYSTPEYSLEVIEPTRYCVGGTWYEC